jgi:hypothetical protein
VLAIASLVSAAFTGDPVVLRVLVVAASVGAFAGAVLLRLRERAGEVELEAEISARARDEARFEDRAAELEFQAEVAEEQVKRLERRLLAQRSQIARAEGENARLLRERARIAAEQALREAEEVQHKEAAARGNRPTPTAYLKAAAALRGMERRAAVGQAQRIAAQDRGMAGARTRTQEQTAERQQAPSPTQQTLPQPVLPDSVLPQSVPSVKEQQEESQQAQPLVAEAPVVLRRAGKAAAAKAPLQSAPSPTAQAQTVAQGPAWARAALPPLRPASAVPPSSLSRQSRDLRRQAAGGSGTFNFFSRQEAAISTGLGRLGDLADVVGDEAAAAQDRYAETPEPNETVAGGLPEAVHDRSDEAAPSAAGQQPRPESVDLTAEDETEPIDVRVLRAL